MQLHKACTTILSQLTDLISQIKEEDYIKPSSTLNGATIGQHLRHTIEFFLCLEQGLTTGVVNYDKRDHDRAIENDKFIAHATLQNISEAVKTMEDRPLKLEVCYYLENEDFTTLPTTYRRELVYNIEHAVHHMAIMKIGVRETAPYIELPKEFGIATSTIRHQQKDCVAVSK